MHYNQCVGLPVHPLAVSAMLITFEPHDIFIIKICIHMHVKIVYPLACVTAFLDRRGVAEHQSGRSWSVSENAHILNHMGHLDQVLHTYSY